MKMLRQINKMISLICVAVLLLSVAGCASSNRNSGRADSTQESTAVVQEPSNASASESEAGKKPLVRVGTLKGPTGMGMAGMMQSDEDGTTSNNYEFTIRENPTDIRTMVINGEVDIAAMPTNMAAVLYNKNTREITMLAVNTLGIFYVLQNGREITSVADLKGKTLYSTGQGAVPEYVLNYILSKNGINPATDVEIIYEAEHAALATKMVSGDVKLGMLPQPFVTTTQMKNADVQVALDMTGEWDNVADGQALATGCIVVRNEFLESNREAVNAFLDEYQQSVLFANRDITDAAIAMEKYEIIAQAVAEQAIPGCNIVYQDGDEMKAAAQGFMQVLFEADPASVGGSVPDDAFYYQK